MTDNAPDCLPWRRMTPEEYAAQFRRFGPHRATVELAVVNDPASAEVSVFLVGFTGVENDGGGERRE